MSVRFGISTNLSGAKFGVIYREGRWFSNREGLPIAHFLFPIGRRAIAAEFQ